MNFKELFDSRVERLRVQIGECIIIAETLKDDPIVSDTALAMCDLDARLTALETIDFGDLPPELITSEETGFYRLVRILCKQFRTQCELRQLATDQETLNQESPDHE